jgi:hypothetical protein
MVLYGDCSWGFLRSLSTNICAHMAPLLYSHVINLNSYVFLKPYLIVKRRIVNSLVLDFSISCVSLNYQSQRLRKDPGHIFFFPHKFLCCHNSFSSE